jgi:hypothetical protein
MALVALALFTLAGCPSAASEDAGNDAGRDAAVALDSPIGTDAFVTLVDAPPSDDAATPIVDDASVRDTGVDTGTSALDTGATARDTGPAAPGMCDATACTPTCFRPITCVTVCGGPVTMCGCCACAAGSVDTSTCGSSM